MCIYLQLNIFPHRFPPISLTFTNSHFLNKIKVYIHVPSLIKHADTSESVETVQCRCLLTARNVKINTRLLFKSFITSLSRSQSLLHRATRTVLQLWAAKVPDEESERAPNGTKYPASSRLWNHPQRCREHRTSTSVRCKNSLGNRTESFDWRSRITAPAEKRVNWGTASASRLIGQMFEPKQRI